MTDPMTPQQFHAAEGAEDWRVLSDGAYAFFQTESYASAARFIQAISGLAGVDDHDPAIDLRHDGVTVRLLTLTREFAGLTTDDLTLARQISAAAREQGITADPSAVQSILIVPGAPDTAAVTPFWRAVLGYEPRIDSPDDDLVDSHDRGPSFWFETMKEPRQGGEGAIHLGIFIPYEQAEARLAAALAAGGHLVRHRAPMWWTVADAAGNEADIATTTGRD